MEKVLKYKEYLDKYKKKCPAEDCIEKDFKCFRWIHKEYSENDFLPQIFMNPPRIIDKRDLSCKHFSLSVFDTLINAINKYKKICGVNKENYVEDFKKEVGEHSAELALIKDDGVSDTAHTITGHISFYPYENCKLLEKVIGIFDNFA